MEFVLFQAPEFELQTGKDEGKEPVLTEKAEKILGKSSQGLSRFIPRKVKVEVWSENIPQLSHVAELLAEELGAKRKFTKSIGSDEFSELYEVMQTHAAEKCVVVVCEHSRIVRWCQQLLDYELPFNESSAAGFRSEALGDAGKNELLWFVRQTELGRIR